FEMARGVTMIDGHKRGFVGWAESSRPTDLSSQAVGLEDSAHPTGALLSSAAPFALGTGKGLVVTSSDSRNRTSSFVAGRFSRGARPGAAEASACLTAAHTETANKSGGSPTALLPQMFSRLFGLSRNSIRK